MIDYTLCIGFTCLIRGMCWRYIEFHKEDQRQSVSDLSEEAGVVLEPLDCMFFIKRIEPNE